MTAEQIISMLRERFAGAVLSAEPAGPHPHAVIDPPAWPEVARFLRDQPELRFDLLRSISGVDYPQGTAPGGGPGCVESVYDLVSTQLRHPFAVKVRAARDEPHVPSVAGVWPAADWHEREAFDLLGIVYDGHPNLERILLPDDWLGHPLRKDYVGPEEYGGIPCAPGPAGKRKTTNGKGQPPNGE